MLAVEPGWFGPDWHRFYRQSTRNNTERLLWVALVVFHWPSTWARQPKQFVAGMKRPLHGRKTLDCFGSLVSIRRPCRLFHSGFRPERRVSLEGHIIRGANHRQLRLSELEIPLALDWLETPMFSPPTIIVLLRNSLGFIRLIETHLKHGMYIADLLRRPRTSRIVFRLLTWLEERCYMFHTRFCRNDGFNMKIEEKQDYFIMLTFSKDGLVGCVSFE